MGTTQTPVRSWSKATAHTGVGAEAESGIERTGASPTSPGIASGIHAVNSWMMTSWHHYEREERSNISLRADKAWKGGDTVMTLLTAAEHLREVYIVNSCARYNEHPVKTLPNSPTAVRLDPLPVTTHHIYLRATVTCTVVFVNEEVRLFGFIT